jgi:tRNA/rRNA methyltransferase
VKLDDSNFWRHPNQKSVMWRNIQNVYTRADLTEQEVQTLHGMFRLLNESLSENMK